LIVVKRLRVVGGICLRAVANRNDRKYWGVAGEICGTLF
jgi:hypothetical protein